MTAPKNNNSYENFAGELGLGTTHVESTPAKEERDRQRDKYGDDLPGILTAAFAQLARLSERLASWSAWRQALLGIAAEYPPGAWMARLLEQGPEFKAAEQPAAVTPLAPPYCAPPEENVHLKNAQEQLKAYRAWEKQLVDHARYVENVCGVEPSLQNLITHGPGTRLFMPAARPINKVWKEQPNENLADTINSSSSTKHGADAVRVLRSIPDDDGADGTVRERSRRAVPSPASNTSIEVGSAELDLLHMSVATHVA